MPGNFAPPAIIRREVITVKSAAPDDYGNLKVVDTHGKDHKIGEKRSQIFNVFQVGAVVELGYASFKGKDYIAIAAPAQPNSMVAAAQKIGTEINPTPQPNLTNISIERQVSAKLAMEFCEGTLEERLASATEIFNWIHGTQTPPARPPVKTATNEDIPFPEE